MLKSLDMALCVLDVGVHGVVQCKLDSGVGDTEDMLGKLSEL